jgi:hypothetical protein
LRPSSERSANCVVAFVTQSVSRYLDAVEFRSALYVLLVQSRQPLSDGLGIDRSHEFANELKLSLATAPGSDAPSQLDGIAQLLIFDRYFFQVSFRQRHQTLPHFLQRQHFPFAFTLAWPLVFVVQVVRFVSHGFSSFGIKI